MKLKIWSDQSLSPESLALVREGLKDHELVFASSLGNNLSQGGKSAELDGADIAFGQPDPIQCAESPSLKWVQISSAGYTRYEAQPFQKAVSQGRLLFTNSSSVFQEPCAQHLVAFMLAQARQLPLAIRSQLQSRTWEFQKARSETRILNGQCALIVGYGAIGKRVAELLAPYQMEILAFRRTPSGEEPVSTYGMAELDEYLPRADHVLNILPASRFTDQFFSKDRFQKMKRGSIFYNIGRGTTVDQEALIAALNSHHLAAALLDVTTPEPLPPDDPLWSTPNLTITPHVAGGFEGEQIAMVNHFLQNLNRFLSKRPLEDLVDLR